MASFADCFVLLLYDHVVSVSSSSKCCCLCTQPGGEGGEGEGEAVLLSTLHSVWGHCAHNSDSLCYLNKKLESTAQIFG